VIIDEMYRNFFDYHTPNDEDIGRNAWEETKVVDGPGNDEETFPHCLVVHAMYVQGVFLLDNQDMRNCTK